MTGSFIVDPYDITNSQRTESELQTFLVFAICVAGKTASVISNKVDDFFRGYGLQATAFDIIRDMIDKGALEANLRRVKMGKYGLLCKALPMLVNAGFHLGSVTPSQLETIPGIGMKTSRFFILHSRPKARIAVVDTHLLKYLRARGIPNVPDTIPTGKRYLELEQIILDLADEISVPPDQFDLRIWTWYSRKLPGIPTTEFITRVD